MEYIFYYFWWNLSPTKYEIKIFCKYYSTALFMYTLQKSTL